MDTTHLPRRVPVRQSRSYGPLGTASLTAGCALIAVGCSIIGSKPSDTPRPPASVAVTAPVSLPAPPIVTVPAAAVIAPAPEPELPQNLYDTRRSNFADVLDGYDEVVSHVLVFADDSLVLRPDNKAIISDVLEAMTPETDVLSVVGCSHGATSIAGDNGNALLALGRAHRVKEALLFAGVDPKRVLDEGCWAPHAFPGNRLPARGVVLALQRERR